jgi:Zn-dependent M28 family amino/carboxypeptidase
VVAILRGSDPAKGAILLTAHLDHLGVGPEKNGDRIYNGADDNASGTTAVIELARVFAAGFRPGHRHRRKSRNFSAALWSTVCAFAG